jgi:hypothetical protein
VAGIAEDDDDGEWIVREIVEVLGLATVRRSTSLGIRTFGNFRMLGDGAGSA